MTHSEQLYDALINKGYTTKNIGDRDTFLNKMQDKGNRRILYDYISKRGDFRIGNYDNYEQRLASDFSIPQPLQENASLALKHPIYKANPMLRGYSFLPDSPEAVETGQKASTLTFDNIEPVPATPDILQRNAQQISASAISPSASNSEIGGVAESRGGYKPQDPLQEAVAQDLIGKASSQAWQRDILNSISGMRQTAQKNLKARTEELRNSSEAFDDSQWLGSPSQYGYAPMTTPGVHTPNLHSDHEANMYRLTIGLLDEAEKHIETVKKNQARNGFQQATAGVGDALFDIDTLTLGIDSLAKNATLKAILDKADADQQLTQAEEALLNAALYKQFTEAAYTNGRWYNVGKGIGEQVPYMLEFALSGGTAGALTKGANKAIGKAVTKYINNLALKNGSKIANRTARNMFTRGTRALGNTLSQLPGGIMRATVQVPLRSSVYNDIIERQIGTLGYSPSASNSEIGGVAESRGGLTYTGRIDAENTTDAIAKGLTSGFITNLTESIGGEGIQFITNKIGGLMGKGISAFRSPRWYNHIREGLRRNGWAQFISASSLQGPIAEYGEEILDQTLNAIFVGDSSLDPNSENYVFDTDNLINTAITTGAISLFMGAAGGIASAKVHRDVNKAYTLANQNLRTLQYSDTEINALNNIATSRPQEASKWVSSITRTMRTLATRSAEIESTLSPEARTLIAQPYTEAEFNALSPYDQQAISALYEINNRFNELTIQRDYVVAGTNYNALIKGLKESVAPQAEAAMANINANALRDSDYTVRVKFKGQDGYLVTGTADITDMPDGSTIATLPAGNIYQVRTKAPDGQWVMQQAIAEDIQPISVTPTQQLIDETTARIYKPVEDLITAEHAQAQAEVLQSQPTPDTTNPNLRDTTLVSPNTQQAQSTEDTTTALDAPVAPTAPNISTQSTEPTPVTPDQLSDDDFNTHIGTLTAGDAIQAITERRGAEEADQYASWRKGILTKERDKAQKALTAKIKPFDPARYPNFAQMKQEERKYNEQLASHRNKQQQIIDSTTAEIADIDRYLANRNRQIAAEREAENPLRNGIAEAVAKQPINTLEQYIARYIALGGRLRMTDQFSNGLAAELGITHGSQEHRELLSILSNNEGMTPEQLAQDISENIEPEYRHLINGRDTQDIRNAIIDTIAGGVTSRRRAYDFIADINQRATDEEQRYIDEQELQAEIDADTDAAIRDYEELLLSSITPHNLTIIDAMAGDYWDELLDIQQYEQEAYNDYDTPATSTAPRNTQQGAESTAIQSSTQPSDTTPISQDSQDTATIRPTTPQPNGDSSNPIQLSQEKINILDPRDMSDAEKQRRGDMLRNAFAIEVQKNIITSTPEISARKAAELWWDENVSEPALYSTEVGEVEINKNSIESSLAHRYGQKKLDAITSLIEGFENAVYLGTMEDGTRQEGVFNHYFAYPIMYDGELNYVFCRAMQDANKNRLYVHEVFLADNITKGNTLQTAASQPHGGISLYRDILANVISTHKDTTSSLNNNNLQQKIAQPTPETTNPNRRDTTLVSPDTQQAQFTEEQSLSTEDTPTTLDAPVTPAESTTDSYTITPTQYTTKRGNVLDMHLVKFNNELTKQQYNTAKQLAKADKGWYDREKGGFMMRSQESAQQLADAIASQSISMTDIQSLNNRDTVFTEPQQTEDKPNTPIWQYAIHVDTDGYTILRRDDISGEIPIADDWGYSADSPQEMLDILRNPHNNMQEVLDAVGVTLENKIKSRELDRKIAEQRKQEYEALRANGVNGYKIGQKVIYKGKKATIHDFEEFGAHQPVLDTGMAPVIYEVAEWSDIEHLDKDKSPAGLNAPVATGTQETNPTNQGQFNLVSDDRMAELKDRLRKKLGGQMNIGIDPEILSIGLEIAVGHIDRGIKSFTDFARVMIADLGDTIRPYLKAFYNGARELPEVIETGLANDMTPYNEVQQFDVTNFDRTVADPIATAQTVARETEVTNEVNVAKQRIKRSNEKKKSLPSQSNQLNLFDNDTRNEQNTRTDNSRTQPRREELPETESVEPRTSLQHPVEIGRSERGDSRISSSQSGDRPIYDVNKNYTNDEIAEIVSSVTDIVDGKVVITGQVTDDIKAIARQYRSGGVAKKGRGILDEYYTDGKIVDAVNLIIAPYFKGAQPARVLEPSIGIGNFISAVDNIPTSQIVAFEINDTTARIAKILYPQVDVNLRSFETEFIDETGNKKPLPQKFNLIIGNPPYGSHRGIYKGLGEESKIARYEDYFVKRSLDVLNEGGVLAMVLPSSWIDRHTRYGGYTIEAAYRLPSGAFEATEVGTDIVVLRKDNSVPVSDHTPYFEQHPDKVLGEVKQRKGRYGKMEDYVQGDIDTAIEAIKRNHAEQLANRLDIIPSNDNLNNIEEAIDETGSTDKATTIVQTAKAEANNTAPSNNTGKKSKYKTELNRGVETVPTSQQFSHAFSEGEVEAFADTDYDGTINNPTKHRKYANYMGGRFVHDFYYAEGNIYDKLYQLEQEKDHIIKNYGQDQFDKQKRLLENVLPKRKGLSEITISPNTAFVKNLYIDTNNGRTTLREAFIDFCRKLPYNAFGDSSSWEVIGYVNNEQVYGQDKQRNALVRERRKRVANDLFIKFLNEELSPSAQNQVVAAFNHEYNSTYRPDYSRVPMFSTINKDFKGKPLKLTSVQLAGIGRMTVKGVGLLAHEVGFGKTLSGILAMHEAMTRGFATKPLIVVPNNNILEQWVETIKEVLPQATVNTLGNLGTSYDLTDFNINDGEFTIVTYEGLKAMSFSDDTYNRLAERFSYITEDLNKHQSERDIQKEIEKKNELKGKMRRGTKTSYMFEDFGFDWLTIDEVHNANHIVSKVRLDKSVASDFRSQSQRTSDLGLKTWLAAQYIQEENNGRNVLLLSATPFTNKPLEYYSILSLIANDMLRRKGFFNVDQFFETFMEADNELEIAANGKPTQKTNIRRFRNNGLFQQLLSEFIDIKGEEDNPDLVRPNRINKEYKIAQNEITADAIAAVQDLLNDNDTVLQGIGHARAAAFSPYATSLLGITPRNYREFVNNSPKIDATIKMIEQNKKDRPDAGQIIYSEVGVEFFPMIRDYLVNVSGFKPSEVRIITGATSNNERINIQSAFNKGEVKVVIGSPAIKEGLNLQENTTDMYILSLPWNFTQLRQIEGRGWRQGNKWGNIRINYMLTNDSVDVFMLQRLQLKQGLYNEAMKSGAETLDVSDIDTSELKTALITDPDTRAEIVTIQERAKLERQKTQIEADLSFVLRKFEAYNKLLNKLEEKKKEINLFKEWAAGGNTYWADRITSEENKLNSINNEIQEEKERLQKKGVNVDDITRQTEQAQSAIKQIEDKIENLKDFKEQLSEKYRKERQEKEEMQGDLLATYINERKAENNSGFYTIRPKDAQSTAPADNNTSLPQNLKDRFSFRELEEQIFSAPASDSAIGEVPQGEGVNELSISPEEQDIIDQAKTNGTYLLAPNGRPTNLTPRQWVQVRTRAFKEWFGDWELSGKKNFLTTHAPVSTLTGNEFARQQGITLTDQVEQYFDSIGGKATSPIYGDIILDRRGADDSLAHGMSRNKAIAYAAVKDVIETGILIDYDTNHKGRGYDSAVIAAPIEIAGERYICYTTIIRNKKENRYYLHEVWTQKNLTDVRSNAAQKQPSQLQGTAKILQNILTASDNASKIIDENGEPRVMYHGTGSDFTTFDMQDGSLGRGAYFTSNWDEAAEYAKQKQNAEDIDDLDESMVLEVFLNVRDDNNITHSRFYREDIEVLATSPNQIKSAIDNIGTFDSNNPDTRFRSASPLTTAQQVARQELPRRIEQHTAVLAKRLGVPITVLHSNDALRPLGPDFNDLADWLDGNIDGHTHRMAGMFDAQSNKLFIFAHNIARTADPIAELESTITHEVVAHYGLRQLLGEQRLNTLLSDTWSAMPQDLQLRWGKYAMNLKRTDTLSPKQLATLYSSPAIQHKAAEEYIAHISESGVAEPTLWQHICATFRRLLRRIGLYSYKPTEADIRYILSQSYSYLTNKAHDNQQSPIGTDAPVAPATATTVADTRIADSALSTIEQATAEYAQYLDNQRQDIIDAITPAPDDSPTTVARKVMFRSIGGELVTRDNTDLEKFLSDSNRINNAIAENDARHKHTTIAEAHYDSMQRLHNLLDDLRKQGALIDERFDPWLTQNQARSRAQAETNIFDLTYRQPLYEAIAQSIRALFPDINTSDKAENAKGYSHLSLYAQARTAVERQAIKSAQDRAEAEEKGEEYKERDFGGLAGIQEAIFGLYSAIDDKVEAAKGNIEKLTEIAIENGIPTVQEYIDNAEAKLGSPDTEGTTAHQLWTAIRTISAYQLTYSYNAGLTSRAGYQTLTYGHNIDGLLRDRYNMQVKQIKDNPGSYDNVTDYDNDGNATGTRKEINDNARIALNKLNQEYAEAIDAVPMPGKNGSWQTLIDTGWLTEEQVNGLHRYYMYYMPLKGHAELTAEDIVDYENKTPRNLSKIKAVEGHSHLAKDPFNQLILDTHGAIQNAEQNRWRTHLYNILTNNPNPSQYVVEQRFYKIETKSDGSKEYVPYGEVETINGVKVFIPGRPTAEELANGTALSYNNRFTRAEVDIPITNDQRKEHSVTVVVDGEAYSMFFYDKRIADAINGTNIKRPSDWLKYLDKLQALNRLYAGLKTSLNPTFTLISNLPRDWAEMVSNNLIEHGLAHAVTSFIYRVRATRVGDVQAALRKHQAGELLTMDDATTDVERYVVEFFNNGGSVNITQLPDYDTAKVELMEDLNTYMRTGEIPQGNSWARAFNNMAERVELAPRLATYIASRKLGHNISQSINDAKEATVNFDRKGSLSGIMGMFQLFYNASAQSVRRQIGLARRHPVRFAATYATIGLLSPLNCIMLSYIASLLLGDDDDNLDNIARNYFAINPELRRRYFIILIGDNYIRIPMAVNYLPYVTLGDVIANWRLNPNYRSNPLKDTLDIVSALLDTFVPSMFAQPIGFAFDAVTAKNNEESANAWRSLAGSLGSTGLGFFFGRPIEPLMQSLGNYNFMGSTLFDMPYDKNSQEPAYLRARQYTQPVWVWASHLLNDITGGNDVHAGWLNIAPEQIENVMTVFGGYGEYGENIISLGIETASILSGEKPDTEVFKKSFPMLSRLYGGNVNEQYNKTMQSMFYDDMTALAGYEEYRKNAITPSTRADFDRTYSPDEQRYFADLATMETIAKRIRKEIKAATPEGESPKYHEDERLKQLYNLANEQFHSLASGSYTPVDAPLYTYKYIEDALTKTPYRMADGTYRLIDYSREKKKAGDDNYVSVFDLPDDTANALIATYEIYRKAKNGGFSQLPSGYYPGMALDEIGKAHEQVFSALVDALDKQYNTANIQALSTNK